MTTRSDRVIIFLTLFLLTLSFLIYLSMVLWDYFNGQVGPLAQNGDLNFMNSLTCPTNFCPTNILTGEKRCPSSGQSLSLNPNYEVCNPPFQCTSPFTPYAQNNDGSTNLAGFCPPEVACNCLRTPRCAEYITSYFEITQGSAWNSFPDFSESPENRFQLQQRNFYESSGKGDFITYPPFQNKNPSTNYCTIPLDWLNYSSPGCNFGLNFETQQIQECFNLGNRTSDSKSCLDSNSATTNPCLSGVLAYLPSEVDNFWENFDQLSKTTPLACVRGTPCQCNQISIWDNQMGAVTCRTLN